MKTGFTDHSGKEIYTGDIVMYRLGKYAKKSGGPKYFEIVKTKKGPKLSDENGLGWLLRSSDSEYITITDTQYREQD